jgi:hypothetical protein
VTVGLEVYHLDVSSHVDVARGLGHGTRSLQVVGLKARRDAGPSPTTVL